MYNLPFIVRIEPLVLGMEDGCPDSFLAATWGYVAMFWLIKCQWN